MVDVLGMAAALLLLVGLAFIPSKIAGRKGRSEDLWWFLGLISFVLPALIAALLISDESRGPVAAASRWLRLVLKGDLRGAWLKTDYEFRRALARAWLAADPFHPVVAPCSVDDAAESLATMAFDHPLWAAFEEAQLRAFADVLPDFHDATWEAAGGARPIGRDRTLVVFVYAGPYQKVVAEPALADERIPVVLRYTGQEWLVARLGEA